MPNHVLGLTEHGDRNVALIDDMEMRRAGLACLLEDWIKANSIVLATFASPVALAESEGGDSFRMVIMSLGGTMVDEPLVAAGIEQIRALAPQASLVILSDHKDPGQIVAAFHSGAQGYMSMGTDPGVALRTLGFILCGGTFFPPHALADLSQASAKSTGAGARTSSRSGSPITVPGGLTSRQREVLDCLRHGKSNKQIARELNMQEATVKVHIRQIMRRLGVKNRVQAAIEATRLADAAQTESQAELESADTDISPAVQTVDKGATSPSTQQIGDAAPLATLSPTYGFHLKNGSPLLGRPRVPSKH
ncbi:response regulator transcription factor [Microvirga sp. VF16]|uniref:response regulator transcription factor n=1 Tax=Microvirga sp. VF16 TaxID=2807101 RepID=UPI00193E9762|nr:response regulator transcription factor [Microvirga sp. VF16]QRM35983.1 response regulator transcription factor [Microvirga sp. VF16]